MESENKNNKLLNQLELFVKAGETGDYSITLADDDMSFEDAKVIHYINAAISKFRKAMEYDFMKYTLTSDALNIALWDMDVVAEDPVSPNNKFTWSKEFREMLGYKNENDFPNLLSSWSDRLHPVIKKEH